MTFLERAPANTKACDNYHHVFGEFQGTAYRSTKNVAEQYIRRSQKHHSDENYSCYDIRKLADRFDTIS